MRVGIIQSCYIPWRGYFDFINSVDLFVVHDDLQYTKGDWRNRNKIKTPSGTVWLTVPVHYHHTQQLICETTIDYSQDWQKKHVNSYQQNYARAPFFKHYHECYKALVYSNYNTISELNIALMQWINQELRIETPMILSSQLQLHGSKTDRLIEAMKKLDATTYVSGPSAKNYLEYSKFKEANIQLEYKSYNYEKYPQLHGIYEPAVTVLDMLMNCGEDAANILCSTEENLVVVPRVETVSASAEAQLIHAGNYVTAGIAVPSTTQQPTQ